MWNPANEAIANADFISMFKFVSASACQDTERMVTFPVLTHLKELAQEADQYVNDFPSEDAVDAWFDCVKETFIKIRDCKEIKVFDYPPASSSIYGQDKVNRNVNKVSENQIAHIHANKHLATPGKNNTINERKDKTEIDSKGPHKSSRDCKNKIETVPNEDKVDQENSQIHIPSSNKIQPKIPYSPKAKAPSTAKTKTPCTPKAKAPCTPKAKAPCTPKTKTPYTPRVALIPLKTSLLQNCIFSSSERLQTPVMDRTFVRGINTSSVLLSSQSSNNANSSKGVDSYSTVKTRSSLKRKSSVNEEGSNKRQKTKVKDIYSGKSIYPKHLVEKILPMKIITKSSENKAKVPVVVPTLQTKHTPVPSKEKQILEEIKKKEEKAIENRKRVLEERKIKAEENRKRREEKREKTVLKRLKMDKEREEKREIEAKKSQVMKEAIKKPGMKTRVKELIDQSVKESKSGPLTSSKQNEINGDAFKTPASKKSFDTENYELTPVPDSSTYDFSEGEDERPAGKHIPLWAQGAYIKSALIQQFYNPLDSDTIFGRIIDPPDLTEIFCVQKKRYKMRTSSAIWNTPPDRSLRH